MVLSGTTVDQGIHQTMSNFKDESGFFNTDKNAAAVSDSSDNATINQKISEDANHITGNGFPSHPPPFFPSFPSSNIAALSQDSDNAKVDQNPDISEKDVDHSVFLAGGTNLGIFEGNSDDNKVKQTGKQSIEKLNDHSGAVTSSSNSVTVSLSSNCSNSIISSDLYDVLSHEMDSIKEYSNNIFIYTST
jgi:hypothetical protein